MNQPGLKPLHYLVTAVIGTLLSLIVMTIFDTYRSQDRWCVRRRLDGSTYTRQGRDCETFHFPVSTP